MRAKVRWFRAPGSKRPEDVASALAVVAWNAARRMLSNLRKAGFTVDAGPVYFEFLAEALAFEAQVAWRAAYARFPDEARVTFATSLARAMARTLAANESELLGTGASDALEARFIDRLNRRFEEYAEFPHDAEGPGFAFLRYFASLVHGIVPGPDRAWIHEQLMAVEGPEAARAVAKAFAALADA